LQHKKQKTLVRPLSRAAATFPAGANQIRLAAAAAKFGATS